MPTKAQLYAQMADSVASRLTGSWQNWAAFLTTAARLYKYPYHEQLMIYAQRPEATACAEYDLWNDTMGRYIRRGSKGIALVDDSGDTPRLRYVFDISDTGTRPHSRTPFLWSMEPEHIMPVQAMLERRYGIGGDGLPQQLADVAGKLADEFWEDNGADILRIVDDSFLEEYDELNVAVQFKSAATVSITYALMSRCGLEPEQYFDHEDFMAIFDFNTPATVGALGTAVSQSCKEVLRQIGITIQNVEREKIAERRNSDEQHLNLQQERGLSDSQPETEQPADPAAGQIREDAENLSEGTPAGSVQPDASFGNAVPAPDGNRAGSGQPLGTDDERTAGDAGSDREPESQRSDEMGGVNEQLQGAGRGTDTGGTYFQLSFFPSENEQIYRIDEAESVKQTPFAFSFAQEEIDHVLRLGSNTDHSRMRVAAEYQKEKSTSQIAAFLQREYRGGAGLITDTGKLAVWYDEKGIHLAKGSEARYVSRAQTLSWEDAASRIGELLDTGAFASNVELDEAYELERRELASLIWYVRHDFAEGVAERGYLASLQPLHGRGYPEETAHLAEKLADPDFVSALTTEYAHFLADYQQDKSLMRFNYHYTEDILPRLQDLALPRREYQSQLTEVPRLNGFITEDEISAALTYGSSVEGGKGRIYAYFSQPHTPKEKADFLKDEYGWGGHSAAISGSFSSHENHDGKGIKLEKDNCEAVQMSWPVVVKRLDDLIRKDRYLTADEKRRYAEQKTKGAEAEETIEQPSAPEPAPREETQAAVHEPQLAEAPAVMKEITQADIDTALQEWNGDISSKHSVVRYMQDHAREKGTADWLKAEYGNDMAAFPITAEGAIGEIPWTKVQRRIAQLIKEERFYSQEQSFGAENSEPEPRFSITMTSDAFPDPEDAFAIWDSREEAYYALSDGTVVTFPDAEKAQSYLEREMLEQESQNEAVTDYQPTRSGTDKNTDDEAEADRYERFAVVESENGYTVWDDLHDGYYVDDEGVTEEFDSEWQANDYLHQVRETVAEKEAAEWLAVEQAKVTAESTEPEAVADLQYARENLIPNETIFDLDGRTFMVDRINESNGTVNLQDITFVQAAGFPIFRVEPISFVRNALEEMEQANRPEPLNFHITDEHLGEGGPKVKFRANMDAIHTLNALTAEGRTATPEEQQILSRYVGWGGLPDAFDPDNSSWRSEFQELKAALSETDYAAARASTLNAHYTSPTVIRAIYEAVGSMGFTTGNILEPSCGVGNFFGMLPENMKNSRLYGVELDPITGRIAQQLYPKAKITVAGFETTDRRDFYDLAIGNVPFGQYKVNDPAYNKLGFNIHNYFFAKALDQVRPGGVVAFVTSRYTMDSKDSTVRKYLAQRAELLGAIRLPNNAFKANAGTEVVSDIIFLQKRDRVMDIQPDWVRLGQTENGYAINSYFADHPEMVLGNTTEESTAHGMDYTVAPIESLALSDQLHDAVKYIRGQYTEAELPELGEDETVDTSLPADPDVKNYSYTVVDGSVYYRENSRMVRPDLNATAEERIRGMVALRDCVHQLIDLQMDAYTPDSAIAEKQGELNRLYDSFSVKHGLLNDRANRLAFSADSSYYLLCSLEVLDDDGQLKRKADMFTKRTIRQHTAVSSVDTPSEALAISIGEKARVDLPYMSQLCGKSEEEIISELTGVIFKDPAYGSDPLSGWQTADEYLSGNVRKKLREATRAAAHDPAFQVNVSALEKAQPKDLDASEIEVRLGATWISPDYYRQFMYEVLGTPRYLRGSIDVKYAPFTAEWQITGKTQVGRNDVAAYTTYGTDRANAYRILEDSLNLRDVRIYDTIEDADGKEKRVLNAKETTLAAQKQQALRDAFKDWIWKDPERRQALCRQYNEEMNSTRPREYDGSHIVFSGMNPEIQLREHQKNAIAHVLYGGNTLLAHEVGAGKTFEMVAAAMESKRLGLCQKSIFVVPNHLTEQWASEFLRLYPSANILVTTKKDFETHRRKKFCARIATGDYDAVIIGHSQFERIPISRERQERLIQEQIWEITSGIEEVQASGGERFTVKQLERTRKGLEARLEKLRADSRKDDVVTFEQLGCDRMFVDESDNYKNLFLYTKMRNVAGLSTTDAQKSSDMFAKCRYLDEVTGNRGTVFATGTPISNSMTEMYTIQRYLQYDRLQETGMTHFDCWASRFGETVTALELAPEGTGYRARTRFAKFFNLPELMAMFKEVADIKTADQLNLPTPEVEYHTYASKPTEIQQEMVKSLSERASKVHSGTVDPTVDNMLKITSDGRKLGLDQRIINPMLPDEESTKVNQCVNNVLQFWRDGEADKLTQLVFCDISTPQATPSAKAAKAVSGNLDNPELHGLETSIPLDAPEPPFTIYADIRKKLIEKGIPAEQIAFIHEANTDARKKELFGKVRSGQVRVLLGSTAKMGAGTNVQDRLIALHDLDCPWRPRDLTQRKGRIERQGNQNETVHVCRYVTEGTFDAYLWQTVENKQKFISQIMSSKSPVRSCEDVDETALSFAEIKALCAGDPRIKERMDLDVEVSKLKIMKADHQSKQFRMEDNLLKYFPEQIEANKGYIKGLQADMETLTAHPHPADGFAGMEVRGDTLTDKENAGAALLDACKEVKGTDPVQIGSYRGFTMTVSFDTFEKSYTLALRGQMTHRAALGTDPRGNLTRIDNALAQMPERLSSVQAQLENLYQQQSAAQAEVGKPFPHEEELRVKTARLTELDSQLNMDGRRSQPEQAIAKSSRPSVLESLKRPMPSRTIEKKSKPHEEVL